MSPWPTSSPSGSACSRPMRWSRRSPGPAGRPATRATRRSPPPSRRPTSWASSRVQRPETKARARALQLLYAWDLSGRPSIETVVGRLAAAYGRPPEGYDRGADLAAQAIAGLPEFDARVADAAQHWRLRRPRDRPGGERLAGSPARSRARRSAGASLGWTIHLRAARAWRGAPAAAGELLRRRGRGHQQAPAVPPGAHRPAVLRPRAAPLRRDGLPRSELADCRRGVGGRAAHPLGVSPRVVSRYFGEHARRPGAAGRAPRADRSHLSGRRCDLVRPRRRRTAIPGTDVLVRGASEAL